MALFDFLRRRRTDPRQDLITADEQRLAGYARYLKAYQGWTLKEQFYSTSRTRVFSECDYKRLKFNFNRPVVNLGAAFLAALPLDWEVTNDPVATAEAYRIWGRSDSLLEAARCAGIYGEVVALATQDEAGLPRVEFVDPNIAFPTFNGKDYGELQELDLSYAETDRGGRSILHREFYDDAGVTVFEDDVEVLRRPHTEIPAAWIRNLAVKGLPYGFSDIDPIIDLVDEYDHVGQKQTRIIDYYASPNIVMEGVQKGDVEKKTGTIYFLPAGSKAYFLEWAGTGPDVEAQLTRLRNAIAEVAQTPAVAFGQSDSGLTSISGVAIRILYGPLINKTHDKQANWTPGLEYVMWLCLRAAGHDVDREAVKAVWPDNIPVAGQEKVAEETAAVAAELRSRRTAMNNLGIPDPDAELKRILIEQKLIGLVGAAADPVQVARAAGQGVPVATQRAPGVVDVSPLAGQDAPSMPGADIATMLAAFDRIVAAENDSIEAARPEHANAP